MEDSLQLRTSYNKNNVAFICDELGCYQERVNHMDKGQFHDLHEQQLLQLKEHFTTKCFLDFYADGDEVPSHAEQDIIVQGFKARNSMEFDQIILAIDGMLIWMIKPTGADCEVMKVGERQFHCFC
ncbi:hypothetical protein ACHAW6_010792 [Cyclotella cf. meneghiniana]